MTTKQQEAAIASAKRIVLRHRNNLLELTQFIQNDSLLFAIRLIDMVIDEQILFASNPRPRIKTLKTKKNAKRGNTTTR